MQTSSPVTASPSLIALLARFQLKPGTRDRFRRELVPLFDTMAAEPAFVNAIVHASVDNPDEVVFYEIWRTTREDWLRDEATKPYRKPIEERLANIIETRTLDWFVPIGEWGSSLTASSAQR